MTKRKQEFVFCVDSDGCAMDTMTYKHHLFFGPLAADVFEIEDRELFLEEWNRVNLYSRTRGINRFVGLLTGLDFANVSDVEAFRKWVETTDSLSNNSLEKQLKQTPSVDLKKALEWSNEVNRNIKDYEGAVLAFSGAREGLAYLKKLGKVFVVSSANKEAVEEEWKEQGLMDSVDDLYCQDRGKKEDVIAQLISEGYDPNRILMIGDSPGDLVAAEQNQVSFYPILVGDEANSWKVLKETFAAQFVNQELSDDRLEDLKQLFWKNLDA
ncbi:HAD family hydrolase [Streptococcus rifensis]